MKNIFTLTFLLVFISYFSYSQLQAPVSSPKAKIFQKVGLVDINLDYSRPSKKGREIFFPSTFVSRLTFSTDLKTFGTR